MNEGSDRADVGGIRGAELLKRSLGVDTWRGVDSRGREVVVKTVQAPGIPASMEFELAAVNELAAPSTAVPVWASPEPSGLTLTRPFIRGRTLQEALAHGRAPVRDVIALAIALLRGLEPLHGKGVVHGDIKPSNIVLADAAWASPVLIDFGLARHVFLDGTLDEIPIESIAYLAPEQAGLIKRGVDARADLYALGLTIYEALARPPFTGASVSELLRQQLTVVPAPIRASVPSAPPALDRIVARLLRKDPRDRYQTARGVLDDLEQLADALDRGRPDDDLVIGATDLRDSITEPAFIGRREELDMLASALADAAAGHGGIALVEGSAGSGKTWLVEELGRRAIQRGFWMLRGQGLAEVPLRPFDVLSQMARDITATATSNASRRARLVDRAQGVGGRVSELLPELRWLTGGSSDEAEPAPPNAETLEARSFPALTTLLDALGSAEEPAIVVIDDAQRADALTLRSFAHWQEHARAEGSHTVIVLVYRPEEVSEAHALRQLAPTHRIALTSFDDDEVRQQIASMAGDVPRKAIELVLQHAAGNPFLVSALLHGLVEASALNRVTGGWQVTEGVMTELQVSGRIADILATRIAGLSAAARKLLGVGALLGKTFDPAIAAELCELDAREAMWLLHDLRGRLLWIDNVACTFVHDRIRETLLADLSDEARRQLHARAARRLEAGGDAVFELAFHYDAAGEPARALPHALEAAELARARQDIELAERYYRIATRGLDDATRPALRYRIVRGLGDVLLIRSQYQDSRRYLDEAFELARDRTARADVEERRAQLALKTGNLPGALEHGEQALRLLDRHVPRSRFVCLLIVLWEAFVQVLHTYFPRWFVGRRRLDGADDEMLAIRVFNSLNGPYFFARGFVWVLWAHLRALNLSERYPPTAARGREYGVHGAACAGFPSLFGRAIRYTRRGAAICSEHGDIWGQARAMQFLALNLCASGRNREAIDAGEEGGRLFDRVGDLWEAQGALNWACLARYRVGDLAGAARSAEALYQRGRMLDSAHGISFAIDAWVRAVEGRLPAEVLHRELARGKEHIQTTSIVAQAEAIRLLADGQPARAEELLQTWLDRMREERALLHESNASLIVYLVAAQRQRAEQLLTSDPEQARQLLVRALHTSRRALRVTARRRNCVPHALREAALTEAANGRLARARALIDESIELADELGARFESALSREVRGELGPAVHGSAAARDLEAARSELSTIRAQRDQAAPRVTVSLIERFDAMLAAGQQIARSLVAEEVTDSLRQGALALLRAQHCSIVDPDAGAGSASVVHGDAAPISGALVAAAVRGRRVVTWPGGEAAELESDEVLVRGAARSALAAPVLVRGEVASVLYATHADVREAFGEEERKLGAFLTTLAGTALENAAGFAQIQEFSRELEHRVEERTAELKARQEQLLHAGRMAAVGTLVAGLSHELNNPLAVILGNIENLRKVVPSEERILRVMDAIERHGRRAAGLVDTLLRFSHDGSAERDEVRPEQVLRIVVELVAAEARKREVTLGVKIDDELPDLFVVRRDIESAILNITTNALQATPAGSAVELSVRAMKRAAVQGICFEVRDSGGGIPADILPRIFDPFFTTKPEGEGTGLGLSLAREAVTSHGGQIDVQSAIGAGTTISLWLPANRQPGSESRVRKTVL